MTTGGVRSSGPSPNSGAAPSSGAIAPTYWVNFTETGLPPGTPWGITMQGGTHNSSGTMVSFQEVNGSYSYQPLGVSGFSAPPAGGVNVNGMDLTIPLVYDPTYPVVFSETGLPEGTVWYLNVTGVPSSHSNGSAISVEEPNGTYQYNATSTNESFTATPGAFTVDGSASGVTVSFAPVGYSVQFTEAGLPASTLWGVVLSNGAARNSTSDNLTIVVHNGVYGYSVWSSNRMYAAASGLVGVEGSRQAVSLEFSKVTFAVTFVEQGLGMDVVWGVRFDGSESYGGSSILFEGLTNGSYAFTVPTVAGYNATPASGTLMVNGSAISQVIRFTELGVGGGSNGGGLFGLSSAETDALLAVGAVGAIAVGTIAWKLRGARRPPREGTATDGPQEPEAW